MFVIGDIVFLRENRSLFGQHSNGSFRSLLADESIPLTVVDVRHDLSGTDSYTVRDNEGYFYFRCDAPRFTKQNHILCELLTEEELDKINKLNNV